MSRLLAKWSLYRYEDDMWAIDCDTCDEKVCNLTPYRSTRKIINTMLVHLKERHTE
jgi:hypothetical protein